MTIPSYTTLNRIEIKTLLELKAPRCAFPVIAAINSYMFDTCCSFPSIKTIIKWCGNHISKTSVERALRWLDKSGIISRGKAKTKTRFTNNIRKAIYGIKKIKKLVNDECSSSRSKPMLHKLKHKQKQKEKNYFNTKNKHKSNSSKQDQKSNSFDGSSKVKALFSQIIKKPRQMKPNEVVMFQTQLKQDKDWGFFVQGFHPRLWKQITGVRPTQQEIYFARHQFEVKIR